MERAYSRNCVATCDAGCSVLTGTVTVAASPIDVPAAGARVQLLRSIAEPMLVREVWSDAAGAYAFEGLLHRPAAGAYTVIGYDSTGAYDPVAKANLVPTPMPPDPAEHP